MSSCHSHEQQPSLTIVRTRLHPDCFGMNFHFGHTSRCEDLVWVRERVRSRAIEARICLGTGPAGRSRPSDFGVPEGGRRGLGVPLQPAGEKREARLPSSWLHDARQMWSGSDEMRRVPLAKQKHTRLLTWPTLARGSYRRTGNCSMSHSQPAPGWHCSQIDMNVPNFLISRLSWTSVPPPICGE